MTTGQIQQPYHHSIETADSESLSSYDRDSIHSTSTTGTVACLWVLCTLY